MAPEVEAMIVEWRDHISFGVGEDGGAKDPPGVRRRSRSRSDAGPLMSGSESWRVHDRCAIDGKLLTG